MERIVSRSVIVVVGLAATLAAVASAAGVLLRGDLTTQPFITVRGDLVDVLAGGVYRFNGKSIAAEGIGWDAVTLFLVVPALLLTLPYLRRGSLRARLFATGILAYFVYQYFEYAMALAYGPLFAALRRDRRREPDRHRTAPGRARSGRASRADHRGLPAPGDDRVRDLHGRPPRRDVAATDRRDVRRDFRPAAERRDDARRPGLRPRPARAARPVHRVDRQA